MIAATSLLEKASLGACLQDLLASRFLPRRPTERIRSVRALPSALQYCAAHLVAGSAWLAYGDADRILFAIAAPHAGPEVEGGLAIEVYFLDENAQVYCAGVWACDRTHGWWLDALVDLSYDCERGWWIETLIAKAAAPAPVMPALPAAAPALPRLALPPPPL